MNQPYDTLDQNFGYALQGAQRNRVLRNTYWLLAVSMVPTILGAWIGVETGVAAIFSGIMGFVLMLGGMLGFIYAIERTKNSALGVPVLLGFTFFMGLILSRLIGHVLGFRNGAELVMTAFGGTAGVFFVMASLATACSGRSHGPNIGPWSIRSLQFARPCPPMPGASPPCTMRPGVTPTGASSPAVNWSA